MKFRLLSLLLFPLSLPALAYQFPLEISEYIDDVKVDAFINPQALANQPAWKPFQQPLPLKLDQVLAAIADGMKKDPRIERARLVGVELKPLPGRPGQWHYLVKMKGQMADGSHKPLFFVVLFNGNVIAAIPEPEAIK